jgi:ribosomal protein S20
MPRRALPWRTSPNPAFEDSLTLAHSSRGWTGARTPSAIKRVRQTARRHAVNQPRRSAAKTLVSKALVEAGNGSPEQAREALTQAISALDRAAKSGAIHRNAADRRKSRLTLKVNAALGGSEVISAAKVSRTTGKAAAAKQARARIAASRATKAKGAQTAAGKAREALAKTSRATTTAGEGQAEAPAATAGATRSTTKSATKSTDTKAGAPKTAAAKSSGTKSTAGKSAASKSTSAKAAKAADVDAKPRASRTTKKS